MALAEFNLESRFLQTKTRVQVILPDVPRTSANPRGFYESGAKYPVLFLLHGTFGDGTEAIRKTNIDLYASENNLAVVLPSAQNTNYVNWPRFSMGYDYFRYFSEELVPFAHNWLPISQKREHNFIAGWSMGAWGALLYALHAPGTFAGAGMMSGVPLDFENCKNPELLPRMQTILANHPGGLPEYLASYENLWRLCREKATAPNLPRLYFSMGEEDFMFQEFLAFQQYAAGIGLPATFAQTPGYAHEWRFWDMDIQRILRHFGFQAGPRQVRA